MPAPKAHTYSFCNAYIRCFISFFLIHINVNGCMGVCIVQLASLQCLEVEGLNNSQLLYELLKVELYKSRLETKIAFIIIFISCTFFDFQEIKLLKLLSCLHTPCYVLMNPYIIVLALTILIMTVFCFVCSHAFICLTVFSKLISERLHEKLISAFAVLV